MVEIDGQILSEIGFDNKDVFYSLLMKIIASNAEKPIKEEETEFISLRKSKDLHENSEMYTATLKVGFATERPLSEFNIKKYRRDSGDFFKENLLLNISNRLFPEEKYFSDREKIRLFPKKLIDNIGTFSEKKILITEGSHENTLYKLCKDRIKDINAPLYWVAEIADAFDPIVLLLDYLPYKIEKERNNFKELQDLKFEEFSKEYFRKFTEAGKNNSDKFEEAYGFISEFFCDLAEKYIPNDMSQKSLMQPKINLSQNNKRHLFDARNIINGPRSMYLGGIFGHPYIANKIENLSTAAFDTYKGKNKLAKERDVYDLKEYNISSEEFSTGFSLGSIYFNQIRKLSLEKICSIYPENEKIGEIKEEIGYLSAAVSGLTGKLKERVPDISWR